MRILITAGPTREPIDPVRFISNRSSGKMGYAVASEAARRGHEVCLISGPVSLESPPGVRRVRVITAEEMLQAVTGHVDWCNVLIMAAAVADWRPVEVSEQKISKEEMSPHLVLARTPDILQTVRSRKGPRLFVGFAAETGDMIVRARKKLMVKGLDLIVANDVSRPDAGFEVDTNRVSFLTPDGTVEDLPLLSKRQVAGRILDWVEDRRRGTAGSRG